MARARTARHPVEPEEQSQEETNGTPSKAETVRMALAEGLDKPQDIVDFASSHGVELTKQMASSYKAQAKAREAKAGGETQPRQSGGIPQTFGEDVRTIKRLIEQAGSGEQLKDLANQLAVLQQRYGQSGLDSMIDAFE